MLPRVRGPPAASSACYQRSAGRVGVTRRLFHPDPATNGYCDRRALRYIAVMGSMCILLSCGIYSMVKGALLLVGRGVGTAANNTTGNISTFVDTAPAPQHVMVRQHINARTSITYLDITCGYLCEQASGTMLVIACASSALCCAAEGCLLLRHVRVRAEEQKLGIARMLELTRPHAKWLLAGCIALVIRLPFSVSLPHFVAETIGTSLSLSLSLAPLRGPDAALAKWTSPRFSVAVAAGVLAGALIDKDSAGPSTLPLSCHCNALRIVLF